MDVRERPRTLLRSHLLRGTPLGGWLARAQGRSPADALVATGLIAVMLVLAAGGCATAPDERSSVAVHPPIEVGTVASLVDHCPGRPGVLLGKSDTAQPRTCGQRGAG